MFIHPQFDPVMFELAGLQVRWYGVMYLLGISIGALFMQHRAAAQTPAWTTDHIWDVLFYIVLGVIVGGRLGYALFYAPGYFFHNPLHVFMLWEGGMSFHGGLIGVLLGVAYYGHRTGRSFLAITDFIAPAVPIALAAGRFGNFINAELWGRVTDVPWAMIFPNVDRFPRHPSQLYELLLEGILLFFILAWYSGEPRAVGRVSALFLILYAVFRGFVECFRQPDPQYGFIALHWLTMGQLLCAPMLLIGLYLFKRSGSHHGTISRAT